MSNAADSRGGDPDIGRTAAPGAGQTAAPGAGRTAAPGAGTRTPTTGADWRPDLSVIVVTHDRLRLALQTLRSALAASGGVDLELIVVDSGSTDGTPSAVERSIPNALVIRERNIGFAAASNRGMRAARGRYLLLLNPDVEIVSGTFADLLATLDAQPRIGAASVLQRAPDGSLLHSIRRFPSPLRALGEAVAAARWTPLEAWREEEPRADAYAHRRSVDWLVGAFLLVRARTLAEVGPLDERFFLYSEEADWCYRMVRAGWQVEHLPSMTVIHHTDQGVSRPDLWAQLSWAKLLFARKHFGRARAHAVMAAIALRHALRAAHAHARGPATRAASERHALAVVLGLLPPPFQTPLSDPPAAKGGRQPPRTEAVGR